MVDAVGAVRLNVYKEVKRKLCRRCQSFNLAFVVATEIDYFVCKSNWLERKISTSIHFLLVGKESCT